MSKYLVQARVKEFYHANNKRIARQSMEVLDRMIETIMIKSCKSAGGFKTVIPENMTTGKDLK